MHNTDKKYGIIGAGLVGSMLSVLLARRGWNVEVFERRPDMRNIELKGGRSINLALSTRGITALERAGLAEEARKICIPMYGRMVHDDDQNIRYMQYGKDGEAINSISRGLLNQLMLRKASEYNNINFHFNERCDTADFKKGKVGFFNTETNQSTEKNFDVVFGTDGAFSAARMNLMKTDQFNFEYKQDYLPHGYKELTMPPAEGGGWRIEKNALHIWPRKSFMMIALPNLDGSFTCTLFLAMEGEVSFSKLNTNQEITEFFNHYFPTAVPHMPSLIEDFHSNPTSSLVTMYCNPWHYNDKITLLGDASHAIVPFYGQGMNAGFEDCAELDQLIDENPNLDWTTIFNNFTNIRKPNADAIAELALRNFIEMRDLVADPHFIKKNKVDKKLAELFPDKWNTLYRLVSFSNVPYSEALNRGISNNSVLETIVAEHANIDGLLNHESIKETLERYIN